MELQENVNLNFKFVVNASLDNDFERKQTWAAECDTPGAKSAAQAKVLHGGQRK